MNLAWLPLVALVLPVNAPLQQGVSQPGASPSSALPRIAIEDTAPGDTTRIFETAATSPVPIAARLRAALDAADASGLEDRLASYRRAGIPVWLTIPMPASVSDAERWRQSLATLLERHADGISILEIDVDRQQAQLGAFAMKLAATEARSARQGIRVALGGTLAEDPTARSGVYTPELAPYVDVLVISEVTTQGAQSWLDEVDPNAALAMTASSSDSDGTLRDLGTNVAVRAWRLTDRTRDALQMLAPVAALLKSELTLLEPDVAKLRLAIGATDVTGTHQFRLLFDERTFATYLLYWGGPAADALDVSITLTMAGTPVVHELRRNSRAPADGYSRDAATGAVHVRVPLTGEPMMVAFNEGAADAFVDRSSVSATRELSVAEIIARHQEQQRAQDSAVRHYSADARMEQHFRPSMTDPGYDVVTENHYFVSGAEIEWEELAFSVNGSKWGVKRPPFPLLQAEKVLSLPLQLRFDADYRYELSGSESVDGFECYVLKFEPVKSGAALYSGTVWIDRETFARVRVRTVQSGLPAPVVSNEEIQHYTPVAAGGRPAFLFTSMTARQILLVAGRNVLVEKRVTFSNFQVNDAGFDEARVAARAGDRVMYKETDLGLRHYIKQGEARVVSNRPSSSVKALAMGVTLDPSYAFPLPIFGINYLDFEFGNPDTQLALLFAGVLAAGNIQRPKLGHTPLDASVDFFAIAAPSSDRVYGPAGERKDEAVLTWPLSTGLNLGWQYTAFQKALFQYAFRFDAYVRDRTTSESFTLPPSTITNGFGGAWEYRRGGYSLVANGAWYRRWSGPQPTYTKLSASLSRDWYFKLVHKIHVNGAWFGGERLDRYAKYQFGMFDDTRIHGVPASGVKFQELAMARGAYSFNLLDMYRLDLFLEQGWGRDRDVAPAWRPLTGLGAAFNVRAPWNTILRVDVGKSLLPSGYRGLGSTTAQIMFLKPLGS
jgi:hypothetical protein